MTRLPSGKKPISGVMLSVFARLWDAARTCPLGKNMRAKVKSTQSVLAGEAEERFNPMNVSLWLGFAGANTHDSVFDTLLESG